LWVAGGQAVGELGRAVSGGLRQAQVEAEWAASVRSEWRSCAEP
jgi:hypothetical protein